MNAQKLTVCLVCSHGGHLTELLLMKPAYEAHNWFLITYDCERTRALGCRKYLVPHFPGNVLRAFPAAWTMLRAFWRERPDVVVSTGSEPALIAFFWALLFCARRVFIEITAQFDTPTLTGRLLYPVSNRFYVQNKETLAAYGPRAEFHGGLL